MTREELIENLIAKLKEGNYDEKQRLKDHIDTIIKNLIVTDYKITYNEDKNVVLSGKTIDGIIIYCTLDIENDLNIKNSLDIKIKELYNKGYKQTDIANMLDISQPTVSNKLKMIKFVELAKNKSKEDKYE